MVMREFRAWLTCASWSKSDGFLYFCVRQPALRVATKKKKATLPTEGSCSACPRNVGFLKRCTTIALGKKKGCSVANNIKHRMQVAQGDITQLDVDAIVNAANEVPGPR